MIEDRWRKSSYSGSDTKEGECVEVRLGADQVAVRDTKHRDAGHLTVPAPAWSAFLEQVSRER
ncbi:DUF397 domain-containing protein [Amycolatopsis nigrescens]|uniref:DUF397 domain-containing protein n=1 Tax=Amycolatopsis nigrescens TaxID=381445 RepID=UPI0003633D11|nr:DUF397 domain-containing protein [Amycolatopsis nigrescens]